MSIIGTIYEDITTDVVGKIGSWQWLVTFISTVLMVPGLFNQNEEIFMLHPPNVLCIPPQGATVLNSSLCTVIVESNGTKQVVKCMKWHVKLIWLIWLKKSWLVFCDQRLKLMSTAIICRFGNVFGCIVFGLISDSFGRKTAVIIGVCTSLGLELILTFCDSEGWFRLFVFLRSLFGSANLYIGLLLICEIASNTWRSTMNTIVMSPRLIAEVCTVPLANAVPNLETYGFISCVIFIFCIALLRWCPESPQWLLYNRKIHLAEITLKKAAKMNGIRLCSEFKIRPVNHRAYACLDETTTCVGVLTSPNIRIICMVTAAFWALHYFLWSSLYAIVFTVERTEGLLLKVFCFVSVFSCLTIMASKKLALRYLLMIHVVLTGATTISTIIFVRRDIVRNVAAAVAISTGVIVHAIILNITPRLFATNIRGSVFGCCHASGHLGSTISLILFMFQTMSDIVFLVVVVAVTVLLALLCLLLPNIDGRELPDVMEDMDYYSELTKPLRWATQKTNSPSAEEIELRVYSFGSGQVAPTGPQSEARVPARRIGYVGLRKTIAQHLRRKFTRRK